MATKKKTQKKKEAVNWRQTFIARFPQYADVIDGGPGEAEARRVFGNELVDLIVDVAENQDQYDFTTQAGIDAFNAKVFATPYYNQTANSKKEFDALTDGEREDRVKTQRAKIAAGYGDLNLTINELDRLAQESARSGLDGVALTQFVNSSVGGRTRGKEDLLNGLDAKDLRKVARAYGYTPADLDDQIVSAITGKTYAPTGTVITADTIRQKGQMMAKAKYFHLSQQLDAGLTLEDIFDPYRRIAAQTLEKNDNAIMMDDPLFSMAFGTQQNGQPSLADWEKTIRTDKRFGYQFTEQAKRDATTLGMSLAKAFGKVK
jgi:hypothetical protein